MKNKILQALKKVDDAELGINVVDLGLIYRVTVNGGEARITMSPTTPFCPYLPKMIKDIEKAARGVPGVSQALVSVVWVPPWNMQMMSREARAQLGFI
ncbi:MAG TPA: metal-sulfur cluster assembly factor [Patescibacteria group bacterium]|nr:metal-sulfur cluster assembly factor [Patescibacteria group bacterium]